jgi:hypothetical protein
LLLLSWIDHSEGATERSRRLAQEARGEFERAGYRLGTAQADAAIAHVEHRLMNYFSAERGALEGVVETKLLLCQVALARGDLLRAERLFEECQRVSIEEAEPRQHLLLTRAWLEAEKGALDLSLRSVEAAASVFGPKTRAGDHTPHLLSRLSRFQWTTAARERLDTWRGALNDRTRRQA